MEVEAANMNKEILMKLAKLQSDMEYVKERLEDSSLTMEDVESIEEYEKEKKEGKLVSHEDLKKELGL